MERERTTTKGLQDRRIISNPQAIPAVVIPTALRTPTAVHVVTPSLSWKELINALLFCRFFLTKKQGCTLQKFISFLTFLCAYIVRYMTEALKTIYAVLST